MKTRKHLIPDVVSDQVLIKLHTNHSAREAAELMNSHQVSSVLVVDAEHRLRGIFTVRDVARRLVGGHLDPDKTRLSQVMTKNPKCVAATESPQFALRLMQEGRIRHLPVTDDGTADGQILDFVSRKHLLSEEEALLKIEEYL